MESMVSVTYSLGLPGVCSMLDVKGYNSEMNLWDDFDDGCFLNPVRHDLWFLCRTVRGVLMLRLRQLPSPPLVISPT